MPKLQGYCELCDTWVSNGDIPPCVEGDTIPKSCGMLGPIKTRVVDTYDETRAKQAAAQSDAVKVPVWLDAMPENVVPAVTDMAAGRLDYRTRTVTPWPKDEVAVIPAHPWDDKPLKLSAEPRSPWHTESLEAAAEAFLPGCMASEALPDFGPPEGPVKSDGGSSSYYELPEGSTELNDLIEHKDMSFARANIFKACYRLGEKDGTGAEYDINKIIFFAERMRGMLAKGVSL